MSAATGKVILEALMIFSFKLPSKKTEENNVAKAVTPMTHIKAISIVMMPLEYHVK